jgi:hypothetical protein
MVQTELGKNFKDDILQLKFWKKNWQGDKRF